MQPIRWLGPWWLRRWRRCWPTLLVLPR